MRKKTSTERIKTETDSEGVGEGCKNTPVETRGKLDRKS